MVGCVRECVYFKTRIHMVCVSLIVTELSPGLRDSKCIDFNFRANLLFIYIWLHVQRGLNFMINEIITIVHFGAIYLYFSLLL